MAGKEDPARNFGAVGRRSAPAEKVEAQEEETKVGAVPSAFVPRSLPGTLPGRHKRGGKKANSMSSLMLRPCSGSHGPTEEGKQADLVLGSLRPCSGGHTQKAGEEEVVTLAKRKAQDSEGAAAGGCSADDTVDAAPGYGGEVPAPKVKWVEMPEEYLSWILGQKREDYRIVTLEDPDLTFYTQEEIDEERELLRQFNASSQAFNDDLFAFQAWVRETLHRNGRVMVPENVAEPHPQLQEGLDELWDRLKAKIAMEVGSTASNTNGNSDVVLPSS